ncbi:hypothetical protein [Planktothricoides sp. SR001]|nr:hypothetical protein [Planktothricoides sp. SR001]
MAIRPYRETRFLAPVSRTPRQDSRNRVSLVSLCHQSGRSIRIKSFLFIP